MSALMCGSANSKVYVPGITYNNQEPAADAIEVLRYVRAHAAALDIDEHRIGVWACSGNVPNAMSLLIQEAQSNLKCAALIYGYMLDMDGSTVVASTAQRIGFVNPGAGKSADDLPRHVPLFIARAGQDQMPGLNDALDRFVAKGLTCNLPLTCVHDPDAPHAFDLIADTETSRETIRQILAFLQFHLAKHASAGRIATR
jgi:acetyl esterase/lipase